MEDMRVAKKMVENKMMTMTTHFILDGITVELLYRARVPLLVVLMEVEGCVPEGGVHVDVLLHGLEDWVGAGVPVEVGLLLVDVGQLTHRLCHNCVQPEVK